jgi:hypothetical protein
LKQKTKTAKYLETLEKVYYIKQTFDNHNLQQRIPGYLIPVPCETGWVRAKAHPPAKQADFYSFLAKKKAKRPDADDLPVAQSRPKRGRSDDTVPADMANMPSRLASYELPLNSATNVAAIQQQKFDQLDNEELTTPAAPISKDDDPTEHRMGRDFNYPVPNNFGTSCWAKFYPPSEILVNQIVDCIGILTESPSMSTYGADVADDSKFAGVPAPYAPRFHAVLVEHLGEANPLIPLNPTEYQSKRQTLFQNIKPMRQALVNWMTVVLGGDALAAEYLLYNLIARPFARSDDLSETHGHIPINFTSLVPALVEPLDEQHHQQQNGMDVGMDGMVSADDTVNHASWTRSVKGRIEFILENIFTKRHTIPLDKNYLIDRNMTPRDNVDFGRLDAGELQLPAGTHVLIDETVLEEGELSEKQRNNMEALSTFIHRQIVNYDFTFYPLPFKTDCPAIVLSQGKSLFNLTCVLRLDCDLNTPAPPTLDEETLDSWRAMIGFLRDTDWNVQDETVSQAVQDDYVEMRAMGNSFLNSELFDLWNSMARASAISFDEPDLYLHRWQYIKSLEHERLSRL